MKIIFKWMPNFKHHRVIVSGIYVGYINDVQSVGWFYTHLLRQKELLHADSWPEAMKAINDKIAALNVKARLKS